MKRKHVTRFGLTLFVGVLMFSLSACNLPIGGEVIRDAAATAMQATAQAAVPSGANPTQMASSGGLQPIAPENLTATAIAAANQPPPATAGASQPTTSQSNQGATKAPSTDAETPCDRVSFEKDVSVPDGTKKPAGSAFTKTWRLKNTGSCTWTSGYQLVFDHGDKMGGPPEAQLTSGTIAPGQTVDVSVNLTAPSNPGTYQGFWKLRNPSGVVFALGDNGDTAFWVKIKVEAGAQPPSTSTPTQTQPAPSQEQTVTLSLDGANSGSVASDGSADGGVTIVGDDGFDETWVTVLQFDVQNIPPSATIISAKLNLPCQVSEGDPFKDLGNLGAYYHYYGNFDPGIYAGIVYDSSLGSVSSCAATQLDVTNSLQAVIFGPPYYQIVLAHNQATDNGADNDITKISAPTLEITYTP